MAQTPGKSHTLLIAAQDRLLVELLAETVTAPQRQVFATQQAREVAAMIQELCPDVAIIESEMQDGAGLRVCHALKARPETCPAQVVLLSRNRRTVARKIAAAVGADECIPLPFSPAELITVVDALLNGQKPRGPLPSTDYGDNPPDQALICAYELRHLYRQDQARQEALKLADQRTQELDRLKSAFISAITNELLSPFVPLRFAVQSLERQQEGLPDSVSEGIGELSELVAGLQGRIKGLVNFAKLAQHQYTPDRQEHALAEILPSAVETVAMMARTRGIALQVFIEPDLPLLPVDAQLVHEAVFQMVHNAMKFNQEGGQIEVLAKLDGDYALIEVLDTGVGLETEQLAVLAKPFGQMLDGLRLGRMGLGVGWATVCYVAQAHDGWTKVQSPGPDQGSTFTLALPLRVATQ